MEAKRHVLRLVLLQETPHRRGKWWNCPLDVGMDGDNYVYIKVGTTKVMLNGPETKALAEALNVLATDATSCPLASKDEPPPLAPEHPISDLKIPADSLAMRVIKNLKPESVEALLEHKPIDVYTSGRVGKATLRDLCKYLDESKIALPREWDEVVQLEMVAELVRKERGLDVPQP
jgi:hypothetical protein